MAYRLQAFAPIGLTEEMLALLLDEHRTQALPRLERLWQYYRNPMRGPLQGPDRSGRWYRLAQESGLPARIVGALPGLGGAWAGVLDDDRAGRREVVIENDIAWRVQAMVDFMFGKPVAIRSTARDPERRELIERALDVILEDSGGIALLQDAALLGHVFGHVDLIVREGERPAIDAGRGGITDAAELERALRGSGAVLVEVIEPRRGIPILDPNDFRRIVGYVVHVRQRLNEAAERSRGLLERIGRRTPDRAGGRRVAEVVEVIGPAARQVYVDGVLREESTPRYLPGRTPVVHVQNISQPFCYEGQGEVEALIPLQDELNTRLSDRASRVSLQSFKMYLAKGIDGFERTPVGPGRVWSTDNMDASIEEFGGDGASPSEAAHIQEIREAMDKASGVPPLASGVVRAKIGNLTSANALRITMMGILAKTQRKRVAYGRGIAEVCRLALAALDAMGVLASDEADRGVRLEWPDPLPVDQRELAEVVRAKAALGVARERLLEDLGETPGDEGVR